MLLIMYNILYFLLQEPAGIFELIEVVGNGTYGQVYKVSSYMISEWHKQNFFSECKLLYAALSALSQSSAVTEPSLHARG